MRIGLLIYGTLNTVSGGYLYDRLLVDYLQRAGHRVEIVSIPWRNYPAHLTDNWSLALRRQLAQLQIDLLLQDELNHPSLAWLNPWLKARVNYPLVSIVHHLRTSEEHPRWHMPIYQFVEKRYLNSVDAFVYNSQTTRLSVEAHLTRSQPSLVILPSASHMSAPSRQEFAFEMQRKLSQSPFRILFVGNLIARKGLHTLIDGLAQLKTVQWKLDIAGNNKVDVHYTAQISRQIERAALSKSITLHGNIDDVTLRRLFSQAHLLAVPSYEGFGIVYLEAMAFGLPVIASTAGAAHEIVEPGINGFLVAPNAAGEIAARTNDLATHREQWMKMGNAARQRFEHHPTWDAGFAELEGWLQKMVAARV